MGEIFLPKNQHTQRKLLNFENWVNGEVTLVWHYFHSTFQQNTKHILKVFLPAVNYLYSNASYNQVYYNLYVIYTTSCIPTYTTHNDIVQTH